MFFPPVPEHEEAEDGAKKEEGEKAVDGKKATEAELEAEAQAVASELPSPPTVDPANAEHVEKKQKHSED